MFINNDSITLQKILILKVLKSTCRKPSCLSACKKSASSLTSFLRYCKEIANLLFWVLYASLVTHTQNDSIISQKTFAFICRQKNHLIPHVFLEILQRYANFLFCVLWACLDMHTQNGNISLQKVSMFLYMAKINFNIHFFLEILHFKESCTLIGQQHSCP